MTLIASYQRNHELVMIGDLLLSSTKPQQRSPALPSRFDGGIETCGDQLVGLTQKLVIMDDHLAVAWAGSQLAAHSIIRTIREQRESIQDASDIFSVIDRSGLSSAEQHDVAFIFYFINTRTENIQVASFGTNETEFGRNHKVRYAGTGAFHFFDTIEFETKTRTGSINSLEDVIATWLSRAAIAFYQEVTSDLPHDFFYGGAFEFLIPQYEERKLEKVPYSVFFWSCADAEVTRIPLAYSLQYSGDQKLVINRFTTDAHGATVLRRFPVGHVLMGCGETALQPAVIDNFFCMHYFLHSRQNASRIRMVVQKGEHKGLQPRFLNASNAITVDISDEMSAELSQFLQAA